MAIVILEKMSEFKKSFLLFSLIFKNLEEFF